jgi:hypothetical protein
MEQVNDVRLWVGAALLRDVYVPTIHWQNRLAGAVRDSVGSDEAQALHQVLQGQRGVASARHPWGAWGKARTIRLLCEGRLAAGEGGGAARAATPLPAGPGGIL